MNLLDRIRSQAAGRFAREFSWIGAGHLVTIVVRLAGFRILTELIEPAVFGVVGLTIAMAILARNVFCAPILEASWRFYADAAGEGRIADHRTLLAGLLRKRTAIVVVGLLGGGVAWGAWQGSEEVVWSFVAVAFLAALESLRIFELGLLNASRRQALHAGWTMLDEFLRIGCAVLAVLIFGSEAVWVLTGYAVGVAAGTAVFWQSRVRDTAVREDSGWVDKRRGQIVRYALPMSLLAIVGWVETFSDRYILAALVGTESTGIYVAAFGLASQSFVMVASILNLAFRPVYNAAAVRADLRRERQAFLVWLLLAVGVLSVGVILMTWLAEPLTGLLLAEQYADAAVLLPWIGAAYALQGCKQVFEAALYAQKRTGLLVGVELVAAIASLGLYITLIPRMGALGAAIGTLGGMAASLTAIALWSGVVPRLILGRPRPDR